MVKHRKRKLFNYSVTTCVLNCKKLTIEVQYFKKNGMLLCCQINVWCISRESYSLYLRLLHLKRRQGIHNPKGTPLYINAACQWYIIIFTFIKRLNANNLPQQFLILVGWMRKLKVLMPLSSRIKSQFGNYPTAILKYFLVFHEHF